MRSASVIALTFEPLPKPTIVWAICLAETGRLSVDTSSVLSPMIVFCSKVRVAAVSQLAQTEAKQLGPAGTEFADGVRRQALPAVGSPGLSDQLYLSQRSISGSVGRLPYIRMPTR